MELPGMTQSLLGEEEPDDEQKRFQPVVNLDLFFKQMYKYHYNRGLPRIVLTQFCSMLSLGFTVAFSVFILGFIDWKALMNCHDEQSCHGMSAYVTTRHFGFSSLFGFAVMGYAVLFFAYWVYRCVLAVRNVAQGIEMERFYREKLGIDLKILETISWNDVVQRLIRLHEHKIYRVAVKDRLTEHDVVSRVMRKENYMIALINKGVLDLRLPWWASPFFGSDKLFLTKSLESSIYYCVLMHIFNDQFAVSGVFLRDVKGLQGRFFMVGVVHFVLLPFMLIFFTVNFFFENVQQFHSSKSYLGPRQWSPLAIWQFREFNEMLHVFESRINKSYAPVNDYVKSFSNMYLAITSRCVAYIAGSFVAVLLLTSVLDESILLFVHVGDHNLIWYLGIFSAFYAAARAGVPDETAKAHQSSPEELVDKIAACTHFKPMEWNGQCHTLEVRDQILHLFPYKARLFAMEMLSVVLTPMVLCYSLPPCAPDILEFIRNHTTYVDGVGAVCDYSTFDLNRYGNEEFATNTKESTMLEVNARPENGKLEQSYISFRHEHPNWTGDEAGRSMMQRLKTFRSMKENQQDYELSTVLQNSMFGGSTIHSMHQPHQYQNNQKGSPNPPGSLYNRPPSASGGSTTRDAPPSPVVSPGAGRKEAGLGAGSGPFAHQPQSQPQAQAQAAQQGRAPTSPNSATPAYLRSLVGSPNRPNAGQHQHQYPHQQESSAKRSMMSSRRSMMSSSIGGRGDRLQNLPSMLRNVLREQNIDYENDFYWLSKFQQEQKENPDLLEQSLIQSQMIGNMSTYFEEGTLGSSSSFSHEGDCHEEVEEGEEESRGSSVTSV